MTDQADENPLEQLIELFVYAPIGMLYEYPDVLPRLIKKGRSQVQLAKFFGQMAARQRGGFASDPDSGGTPGGPAAEALVQMAAKLITELGSQVGLAPPSSPSPPAATTSTERGRASSPITLESEADSDGAAGVPNGGSARPARTARLPIAGYDDLTAKEIIGLLEDLTHDQLSRVRHHESANRNRKTVLAKVERLLS